MIGFKEELKEAVTCTIGKYPDVDSLDVYNALQSVSYDIMAELQEKKRLDKEKMIYANL